VCFSQMVSTTYSVDDDYDTVKVWRFSNGQEIHTLGLRLSVDSVAISPDGRQLSVVWGQYHQSLEFTNRVRTLQSQRTFRQGEFLSISPDGLTLVSGSYDSTIKVWDLQTGQILRTLENSCSNQFSCYLPRWFNSVSSVSHDVLNYNIKYGMCIRQGFSTLAM
jgi:WD40 repeat protein